MSHVHDDAELGHAAFDKGDFERAFHHFSSAAQAGDSIAITMLGWMYEAGRFVATDLGKAEDLYRKAAAAGHSEAEFFLGRILVESESADEGISLLRRAAQAGESGASYYLGACPRITWDERKRWLQKGYREGNVFCRLLLGKFLVKEGGILGTLRGIYLIAGSFVISIVRGIRLGDARSVERDPTFHR